MIDNLQELDNASIALGAWFKSQSIPPAEGIMVTEFFIARMITTNTRGPIDTEVKLKLLDTTIREFLRMIPKDSK